MHGIADDPSGSQTSFCKLSQVRSMSYDGRASLQPQEGDHRSNCCSHAQEGRQYVGPTTLNCSIRSMIREHYIIVYRDLGSFAIGELSDGAACHAGARRQDTYSPKATTPRVSNVYKSCCGCGQRRIFKPFSATDQGVVPAGAAILDVPWRRSRRDPA